MAETPAVGKDMDSSGPRYAPDDPTLPKPWKGLIDGASGYLYYWNPETNVTQYERPVSLQAPVPAGLPVTANPKLAPIPAAQGHDFPSKMGPQLGASSSHVQQTGFELSQLQQAVPSMIQAQQAGLSLALIPQTMQPLSQVLQTSQPVMQGHQMGPGFPHMSGSSHLQKAESVLPRVHQAGQSPYQVHQARVHVTAPQTGMPLQETQQTAPSLPQVQQMDAPSSQLQQRQRGPTFPQVHQVGPSYPLVHQSGLLLSQVPQSAVSAQHGHQSGPHHIQMQQMRINNVQSHQHNHPSVNAQSAGVSPMQQFGSDQVQLQSGARSAYSQSAVDLSSHRTPTVGHMIQNAPPLNNSHQSIGPPMTSGRIHEDDQSGRTFVRPLSHSDGGMMMGQPKTGPVPPLGLQHQEMIPGSVLPHNMSSANVVGGPPMLHMHNYGPGGQPYPNNGPARGALGIRGPSDMGNVLSVEAYMRHHEVTAMGENVPPPFITFEATGFPPEILRERTDGIHSAGFSSPTPIQAQTWPVALQGRDIVAIAKTGSGKTLGYLIPAFIHLRQCRNNPQVGPTVLVLAPTRELATQIQDEVIKFGRSSRISCTCLYGGAAKGPQLRELERGADIVVATPGRLNDIFEMKKISFHQVSFLVLDEADRMLDMGFEPQIGKIVEEIPVGRQTLMYTATWPKEVKKIAGNLLLNPVQVNIGSVDELEANKAITQYVEVVPQPEKQRRLEQILRSQEHGSKIIIFCSTKRLCDQLSRSIRRNFGAAAIHGDKCQSERDWVLNEFRAGRCPILVATDVAARGLDIKDIRVVINYDFPTGIEDYVHRIGRTGRAGATGVSYTFFSEQDWKYAADLIKVLEGANQRVPPEVMEIASRSGNSAKGARSFSRWDSGGQENHDSLDGGSNAFLGGRDSFSGRGGSFHPGGRGGGPHDFSRARGRGPHDFPGARGGRLHDLTGGRVTGRGDMFGGRGNRGRGLGGGFGGCGRHDRFSGVNGRGRFDGRRAGGERSRGRSRDSSPEKVRTWGYSRSRSRSRSWSSRSRSTSRSRSWSRSRSRSCSRSRSYDRFSRSDRSPGRRRSSLRERQSLFSDAPSGGLALPIVTEAPLQQMPPESSAAAVPEAEPGPELTQEPSAAP